MKTVIRFLLLAKTLSLASLCNAELEGEWLLTLTDDNRQLIGLLEVEKSSDGYAGYLEGGPAAVSLRGDQVTIVADSRDVRGFIFDRRMIGRLDGERMEGTYEQVGAAAQEEDPGPWFAVRYSAAERPVNSPDPVDITGTWTATQQLDFRKYTMALTAAGEKWLESYLPYYDQPDVRCTSIGLPALATYSFPFEVIASENRLTMLYEYQGKVRRIWLDGRAPADFMPPSRMGHSVGHWEGQTLVVKTTNLEKTIRDFRGELISENATIEERYSLSEDGDTLSLVVTVHDPENYQRPPVRRRQWQRNDDAPIFPYTCDPDSFYLPMYENGELDMYLERSEKRF